MKEEQLLKNLIKGSKKVSFSLSLLVAFLISGGISFANNTGIALNDDAVSIGKGALSTGKSTIAIGTDSFSSGNSLTREEYNRLLAENEAKLREIQSEIDKNGANKEELKRLRMEHSDVARKIDNLNGLKNNLVDKQNEFTNIESTLKREIEVKRTEAVDYSDKIADLERRKKLFYNFNLNNYGDNSVSFDDKILALSTDLKTKFEDGLDENLKPNSEVNDYKNFILKDGNILKLNDFSKNKNVEVNISNIDNINAYSWEFTRYGKNLYSLTNFFINSNKIKTAPYYLLFNEDGEVRLKYGNEFDEYHNYRYKEINLEKKYTLKELFDFKLVYFNLENIKTFNTSFLSFRYNTETKEIEVHDNSHPNYSFSTKIKLNENDEKINKLYEDVDEYKQIQTQLNALNSKNSKTDEDYFTIVNLNKKSSELKKSICKILSPSTGDFDTNNNYFNISSLRSTQTENMSHLLPYISNLDELVADNSDLKKYFINAFGINIDTNSVNNGFDLKENSNLKKLQADYLELKSLKITNNNFFEKIDNEILRLKGLEREASEYITERETRIAGYRAEIQNLQNLIANSNEEDIEGIRSRIEEKENEIRIEEEKIARLKNSLNIVTTGENAMATGKKAVATGKNSMSTGFSTFTSGENAIAIGTNSTVIGNNSIALGTGHKINGIGSSTIGDPNNIFGNNNHVYGNNNNIGTENNLVNNNFILGSNVISTVNNAIVLGNESTAVENAVSVGSENNLRKIVNVGEGEINNTSNEVIVGKQVFGILNGDDAYLNNLNINKWKNKLGVPTTTPGTTGNNISNVNLGDYVRTDGSGIDKTSWTSNLSAGANIEHPTNTLVTDTIVKNALDNKINKDGSNADVNKFTEKLSKDANMDKPNDKLVTDTKIDKHLKGNYYNKKEVNSKLDEKADKTNTYTKKEVDTKIQDVVVKGANLDGEVVEGETRGVTGDKVAKSINQTNRVVITNTQNIDYVYRQTQVNRQDIKNLSVRMDKLDSKINKVASLSQASANLHFGNVRVGNMAVGAGVATYMGNQAVAVGVAYRPNEDWFMAAKWSGVAGDPHYNSIGGSVSYQFNLK